MMNHVETLRAHLEGIVGILKSENSDINKLLMIHINYALTDTNPIQKVLKCREDEIKFLRKNLQKDGRILISLHSSEINEHRHRVLSMDTIVTICTPLSFQLHICRM